MLTLAERAEAQLEALDQLSKQAKRPRAALIRQAIDDYPAKRRCKEESDASCMRGYFGMSYRLQIHAPPQTERDAKAIRRSLGII